MKFNGGSKLLPNNNINKNPSSNIKYKLGSYRKKRGGATTEHLINDCIENDYRVIKSFGQYAKDLGQVCQLWLNTDALVHILT